MDRHTISEAVLSPKPEWVDGLARFGYAALGVVYCLMGALTAMAAFGLRGGERAGQHDTFGFLLRQPFGQILLALVAAGLGGYVFWQLVQVVKDPRNPDSDSAKGYGRRAGFGLSALFHGSLAFYAGSLVLGNGSSGNGQNGREFIVAKALDLPMGKWLVLLAAAGTVGFAAYQVYMGVSGKFMSLVEKGHVGPRTRGLIERTGRLGFFARGVVFALIGYMLGKAAMHANPSESGDTESAFRVLGSSTIPYLMGVVALGLLCYGLFLFVRAKYQRFMR